MPIHWNADARELHLRNDRISYVIRVLESGELGQVHFGAALATDRSYGQRAGGPFPGFANRLDDPVALECPTPGSGDFRVPALTVEGADGSTVLRLAYEGHHIHAGKPPIPDLPSTYVETDEEADTLEVQLHDSPSGVRVRLFYSVFRDLPAIARWMVVTNDGAAPVRVRCAMSASLDLPDAEWDMVTLSGAWARECHQTSAPLAPGRRSVASLRGASGHEHNPFLVLRRQATTEAWGEAYGLSLVYSGNFLAEAEVGGFGTARIRLGINPDGFCWLLEPGGELAVPEAVLAWSDAGIGDLSATYHRLYRTRLARGTWRDRPRPVLLNSWEATYFHFDESRLLDIARSARDLGIELFVLDDGWFGARDDDTSSLGDWTVDRRKLPNGLDGLARQVQALGLSFGLWIEPEMVSTRSRLFAEHPDWAIGVPGRPSTESRNQLVLDMSRPEVGDHLYAVLADLLDSAPISYVKWDMNRNITEPYARWLPPDRQGELFHRYILGVYRLYDRLTRRFPGILFESCAGGGGRFDPGLLAYAPQAWTSDDTDAIERLAIQWGTSLCYPPSSMGAHVSAVPNHQVGRTTPLATRAAVAFFGVLGYELDPSALPPAEREAIAAQVAFYKEHRDVLQFGRFLRLRGPYDGDGNETAWMAVDDPGRRAIVGYYRALNRPNSGPRRIRLRGLDAGAAYRLWTWPEPGRSGPGDTIRGGDELMQLGILIDGDRPDWARRGDFWTRLYVLEALPDGAGLPGPGGGHP